MQGDFTRFTHDPRKHYDGVLRQQGRVELDADFNEEVAIRWHRERTEAGDVIGPVGAPEHGGGFGIGLVPGGAGGGQDLSLSPGRIYVGGRLVELDATPSPYDAVGGDWARLRLPELVLDGRRLRADQWVALTLPGQPDGNSRILADLTDQPVIELADAVPAALRGADRLLHRLTTYLTQPHYPNAPLPGDLNLPPGVYVLYLDVWTRHITALEDADIREVALGGPDTATRAQTIWQVKFQRVADGEDADDVSCEDFGLDWRPEEAVPGSRLRARREPGADAADPCEMPSEAGYRGPENRLYRVEIHSGGEALGTTPQQTVAVTAAVDPADATRSVLTLDAADWLIDGLPWVPGQAIEVLPDPPAGAGLTAAVVEVDPDTATLTLDTDVSDAFDGADLLVRRIATFKWSRDNGAVVFGVEDFLEAAPGRVDRLRLRRLGRDGVLTLHTGDWVEVLDETVDLHLHGGTLAQVDNAPGADREVLLTANVARHQDQAVPKVRRWDHQAAREGQLLIGGAIPIEEGQWLALEDGVQVEFEAGGSYRTGDHWTVPARTLLRDVLWPTDEVADDPPALYAERQGIDHDYAVLGHAVWTGETWEDPADCRPRFPWLIDIRPSGCCVRVTPRDDLQAVARRLIDRGGGTICLCRGVHRVDGPLDLRGAAQLTVHGEGDASLIVLRGRDQAGRGGIVLADAEHVVLERFAAVGLDVPAVVTAQADGVTHHLTLRELTLVNATEQAVDDNNAPIGPPPAAVRLADAAEVVIEDCRLLADLGLVTRHGGDLPVEPPQGDDAPPPPLDLGRGVAEVRLERVSIRYGSFGIWALQADRWQVLDVDAAPIEDETGQALLATTRAVDPAWDEPGTRRWRQHVDRVVAEPGDAASDAASERGNRTALRAFWWRDSHLHGGRWLGDALADVVLWLGGDVAHADLQPTRYGLTAGWLHEVTWRDNTLAGERAIAFSGWGAYDLNVCGNTVQGRAGLVNLPFARLARSVTRLLDEIVREHGLPDTDAGQTTALWLLLEHLARWLGLNPVLQPVAEALATLGATRPLLYELAAGLRPLLAGERPPNDGPIAVLPIRAVIDVPSPLIGLRVVGNTFDTASAGVRLDELFVLGGVRIDNNVLQSLRGQALRLNAVPLLGNLRLVILAWRYVMDALTGLLPEIVDAADEALDDMDDDDPWRPLALAARDATRALEALVERWATDAEAFLDADLRITGNRVRSRQTAIESNLFELMVADNHITLEESQVRTSDLTGVIGALAQHEATANLAAAAQSGSPDTVRLAARYVGSDADGSEAEAREEAADALSVASNRARDERLSNAADGTAEALAQGNMQRAREQLSVLSDLLAEGLDSYGVWIKGAGCRVIDNQILVPADADPETWARGGVCCGSTTAAWPGRCRT